MENGLGSSLGSRMPSSGEFFPDSNAERQIAEWNETRVGSFSASISRNALPGHATRAKFAGEEKRKRYGSSVGNAAAGLSL